MKSLQQVVDIAWHNGLTYAAIGQILGVSRQRVQQIRVGRIGFGPAQDRHLDRLRKAAEESQDPRFTGAF